MWVNERKRLTTILNNLERLGIDGISTSASSWRIVTKYDLANSYDERFGGDLSHVVVMQHVKKEVIDKFIAELESTMTAISATEANT